MNWKVEPAAWLRAPEDGDGDIGPIDALDAQILEATSAPVVVEAPPAPGSEALEVELEREPSASTSHAGLEVYDDDDDDAYPTPPEPAPEPAAEGLYIPTLTAPAPAEPAPVAPPVAAASTSSPLPAPPAFAGADEAAAVPPPAMDSGAPSVVQRSGTDELTTEEVEEVDDYEDVEDVEDVEEVEDVDDADDEEVIDGIPRPVLDHAPPKPPPEAGARRRRHWVDDVFREHYLATMPEDSKTSATADAAFLEAALGLKPGASVLDVGCGTGRHCFALSDLGYQTTGIDHSLAMLLEAGKGNEGREHPVSFLHADMRELPLDHGRFEAIICVGSSFGYYEDDVNRKILEGMRDMLAPGGKIAIQVFNRDFMAPRLPCRSWWQGPRCMVLDEAEMNYFANRLRVHRTIVFDDGRQFEHHMFLKAFTLHDLGKTLSSLRLRVTEVSGSRDTRGRFYGPESPDIWVVAELKPEKGEG